MIQRVPPFDPNAPILVIDIGNTNTTVGSWHLENLKTPISLPTDDLTALDRAYQAHASAMPKGRPAAMVIGSVVPEALKRVRDFCRDRLDKEALVIGEQVPLPIDVAVTEPKALGVDRACAAAAAFDTLQTGCTIVDFGTAITVDYVDDDGVFRGGAILPGLRLQLRALHEYTAQLPLVEPSVPELPYGRNTREAIQSGVCRGIAGAVRWLVESYATSLKHWPQVVATGGDLRFLAPHCDFLDSLVDHLVLRGVGLAYAKYVESLAP